MSPAHAKVKETISSAWRILKNHSRSFESKGKAAEFSRIIHKLTCASSQIKTIEPAICEPLLERMNYKEGYNGPLCSNVLEMLQATKKRILATLDFTDPDHTYKETCIAFSWEDLDSELNNNTNPSLEDLDRLTATLHKLVPSYCSLIMLEVAAYEEVFENPAPGPKFPSPLVLYSSEKSKAQKAKTAAPKTTIASNSQSLPPHLSMNQQLDRVRQSKQMLSGITEIMHSGHSISGDVISSAWVSIQDLMLKEPAASPEDLNLYSSIIYKLTIASNHLKSTEIKLFDRFLKHNFVQNKYQKSSDALHYFTPEQMKQFEDDVEKEFGIRMPRS